MTSPDYLIDCARTCEAIARRLRAAARTLPAGALAHGPLDEAAQWAQAQAGCLRHIADSVAAGKPAEGRTAYLLTVDDARTVAGALREHAESFAKDAADPHADPEACDAFDRLRDLAAIFDPEDNAR